MTKTVLLDVDVEAKDLWYFLDKPSDELRESFEKAAEIIPVNEDEKPCSGTFNISVTWTP